MNSYISYGDPSLIITDSNKFVWITGFGEFIGTFIFIFLLVSVILNLTSPKSKAYCKHPFGWIVIGVSIALLCGILTSYGIQYGLFNAIYSKFNNITISNLSSLNLNPAFVIANIIKGTNYLNVNGNYIPIFNGLIYIILEVLGGFIGALLANYIFKFIINKNKNYNIIKNSFYTTPQSKHNFNNFMWEFCGTLILFITILGLNLLLNNDQYILRILLISTLVAGIGYSLGGGTGYALNPARDLGPRIAYSILFWKKDKSWKKDWKYAFIPIIGPILGSIIGLIIMPGFLY